VVRVSDGREALEWLKDNTEVDPGFRTVGLGGKR